MNVNFYVESLKYLVYANYVNCQGIDSEWVLKALCKAPSEVCNLNITTWQMHAILLWIVFPTQQMLAKYCLSKKFSPYLYEYLVKWTELLGHTVLLRTKKWVLVWDGRKSRSRLKRTKTSTVSFNCTLEMCSSFHFSLDLKHVPVKDTKNIQGKFVVIAEINRLSLFSCFVPSSFLNQSKIFIFYWF